MTTVSNERLAELEAWAANYGPDARELVNVHEVRDLARMALRAQGGVRVYGTLGYLCGERALSEAHWTLESDPAGNDEETFSLPMYTLSDPFVEIGKVGILSSLEASPRDDIEGRVDIIEQSETPDGGTALTLRQYDQETVAVVYFPPLFGPREPAPVREEIDALDESATAWMREGKGRPIDVTLFHEIAEVWAWEGYTITPLFIAALAAKGGQ